MRKIYHIVIINGVGAEFSVVVPVYKEEKNIAPFLERTESVLKKIGLSYEIIFCLDPSPDKTREVILSNIERNKSVRLIEFSRRFGQPAATMAGILNCKGEACVVIDVDLQDPPELIELMVAKWREGNGVVYAKRKSRDGETLIKKIVSYTGYKVINKFSDVQIPVNTGDFRLIDRRVIEELRKLHETHGFLRGLVAFVGFKQTAVEYDRDKRFSGKGNYNRLFGSLRIGFNGLICFSSRPLQFVSGFGFCVTVIGFALALWFLVRKLTGDVTMGISSILILITTFGGIQLFSLGILGEYIARIYDEVKCRPMYIIDKITGGEGEA